MDCRAKFFVGIELDDHSRARCADVSARLQRSGLDGRFEPPEKFHVTLAFLGWVDAEQIEPIRQTLHAATRAALPLRMQLDTLGAFPHERRPKIVWLGCSDQGAAFRALARAVRTAYGALGFAFEKDAVAHVTLVRIKGRHAHLPMIDVRPIRLQANHIVLFESLNAGTTTRYEVRDRAPLNFSKTVTNG